MFFCYLKSNDNKTFLIRKHNKYLIFRPCFCSFASCASSCDRCLRQREKQALSARAVQLASIDAAGVSISAGAWPGPAGGISFGIRVILYSSEPS